jgi:hypothetical protein
MIGLDHILSCQFLDRRSGIDAFFRLIVDAQLYREVLVCGG